MERVPERWLDPPGPGPAVCDYCGKETDPDELEGIRQKKGRDKYACPTCYEKEACVSCGKQADADFELDNGEPHCEPCCYKKIGCKACGELPDNCDCKKEG